MASRLKLRAGSTRPATTASSPGRPRPRRHRLRALRSIPSRTRGSRPIRTCSTAMEPGRPTRSTARCGTRRSAADWRPYTDGYWHAYGPERQWLWVGRDPFGWPTHHYGRWGVNNGGRWYWMPGRQWAPAWVGWSVGPGYVGWSPLGNHDRPVRPWDTLSQPRGVYPGGTLDPSRAWTVVPSDHFGQRGHMNAYAVDPRTLNNLSAFVSQRVGPPSRYGYPGGGYAGPGGTTAYGQGGYYGGARPRSGGNTAVRGGIGPTRVGPPAPGYGGPTPPPEDPYERAQRAVAPRSRQRPAHESGTAAPSARTPAPERAAAHAGTRDAPPSSLAAADSARRVNRPRHPRWTPPPRPRRRRDKHAHGAEKSGVGPKGRGRASLFRFCPFRHLIVPSPRCWPPTSSGSRVRRLSSCYSC